MKYIVGIIAFIVITSTSVQGQTGSIYYVPDTVIKVFGPGGDEKTLGFSGGFNSPQFAVGDLNKDGRKDLVVLEKGSTQVKTFINYGSPGNPAYKYRPQYAARFPLIREFLKLEDYNCDNVPDLIQRGAVGYAIWRGYYNAQNELCFTFYEDLYYFQQGNGWINAYSEPNDIPAAGDVDGDGDLDFVSFDITGGKIDWYRNMRVEDNLPCDSIRVIRADACWGKVFQGFDRSQTLGITCSTPAFQPEVNYNETAGKTTLHTGNTLCLADADGDGDFDYFNGNISFPDIQYFTNGKVENSYPRDSMIAQDTLWDANGVQLHMVQWPATFWLDYDDDGDHDLLFSPHADGASDNYKTITWYKNNGSDAAPSFFYQSDTLMVAETIDMGSYSHPAVYDYDKDGKPDLFVGADGFFQPNGTLKTRMAYYKNISTPGNPAFELQTLNFASFDTMNTLGAAPSFGDLDMDGKDDMVIGHGDGSVSFYRNMASSGTVQPEWELTALVMKDDAGKNIDSGNAASPFIYDIDKDGKKDLIIGTRTGWLYYYRNISTVAGTVKLQYENGKLGLVRADRLNLLSGYSAPYIGKIDNSGTDYLISGSNSGMLHLYTGFQSGNVTAPFQLLDTAYSQLNNGLSYYSGYRSAPAFGDLDGDGVYEMVLGNVLGGITLYKYGPVTSTDDMDASEQSWCTIYPNPTKDNLNISWAYDQSIENETMIISVYSITGALISKTETTSAKAHASIPLNLPPGMYICKVNCKTKTAAYHFVVQ